MKRIKKLITYFEDSPCVRLPGWQIKEAEDPQTPVGVVGVPQGQGKEHARSRAYAELFRAAPELLGALKTVCGSADTLFSGMSQEEIDEQPIWVRASKDIDAARVIISKVEGCA
jgi:hypothetical protein